MIPIWSLDEGAKSDAFRFGKVEFIGVELGVAQHGTGMGEEQDLIECEIISPKTVVWGGVNLEIIMDCMTD